MTTLLAFAFVLGVLVFVHELGHFLMARWHGVKVLTFSLGFGPKLLKVKRGDTEYAISAIPLGGYVKMAGENPEEQRTGSPDEFLSKSKWQRFQILIMGPAMNIALAVILLWVVLMQGDQIPVFEDRPVALGMVTENSAGARAGLQPGDVILKVDGEDVPTWNVFFRTIGTKANRDIELTVLRDGRELRLPARPDARRYEMGDIGVLPDVHPSIASLFAGDPAEQGGLRAGDKILAINGKRVVFSGHVREAITQSGGKPLEFRIERDGKPATVTVIPKNDAKGSPWIGVSLLDETRTFIPGPLEAFGLSVQRNIETSGLILETLWGLLTGQTSPQQLIGPIGIAEISGDAARAGWVVLFGMMAMISLNLGLLNLMPIPVLDGGHILIMGLETIARRDFSIQVKEKMFLAGFVVLMFLMVTVIYNDLTRISWIERLMPWRN